MTRSFPSVARSGRGSKRPSHRGFSLLEILVVLAIAAILLTLSIPGINSMLSATSITSAANQILGTLTLARQYAITHNRNVAVYFFKYASTSNGLPTAFRGIQAWELGLAPTQAAPTTTATLVTTVPVTKFASIGARIILDDDTVGTTCLSTILSPTLNSNGTTVAPTPPVTSPGLGTTPSYIAFLFRPDGSTSLPLTTAGTIASSVTDSGSANGTYYWSLTVCDASKYQNGTTIPSVPADFATVQLDAVGGTARLLRP